MQFLGLHILDIAVIGLYVALILWLGNRAGRRTRTTDDFYIAGRKLGKFYQFFLNFGTSTDANHAVTVSREIYRQGIGGMWIQYLVLFLTPFYWFTTMLYRRSRLITIGDFFTERFQSPFLGGAFAVFTLVMAIVGGGASYMVAGKTMMALTPKPESRYTQAERESVEQFREYRQLQDQLASGLTPTEQARYDELNERQKRGELHSFISYINPVVFYLSYALIVAAYTVLGGFTAAALTDALQGLLIITFSIILIPIGLSRIGGFEGLHASVPDYMFELFGSAATSEYAWYTIIAIVVANLVSIVAVAPMMATAGSAKNEMTARIGMIGGMFGKRVIMLFWALAGLLAIGLYAGELHDPDLIWGYMTKQLLFPGAIGLMLAGVLAASMSTLDAQSVTNSALFIRNLYQPLRPGLSDRHYILIGRLVIVFILATGVISALWVDNLLELFKYFISLPAVFGAAIWMAFVWRRLTKWAVITQVVLCFTVYAIIPNAFQGFDFTRTSEALLVETAPRKVWINTGALAEDVEAGKADEVGQTIRKEHYTEPVGVYFDRVVRSDPADPESPKVGQGRFCAEIWILSWFGIDFTSFSKAQLVATRFFFDALFPFVLLIGISLFTRRNDQDCLDRFYSRLHTPVQPTPEADARAVEEAARNPSMYEHLKLLPGSNWEILKPGWIDVWGFGGSWVLVGMILLLLWLLATIGS
ncbi:MAG: sodium:solute symporter family protein [Phycisphaerales bacterium]|nr:MAG: sodium:solute symporter family protein [Phycisphaerales bacterium]